MIAVILSATKDLAEPGKGSLWAQILRPGLRKTILTHRFPASPQVVSVDSSDTQARWIPDNECRE
ncbi:hypothetical protein ACTRXD_11195 [Nitrospira sp. T9]|uniref:hypothetical protein n=1 Tax=unclassified Nitrospira TaxID=2652172 RepID=UPI003F9BA09C